LHYPRTIRVVSPYYPRMNAGILQGWFGDTMNTQWGNVAVGLAQVIRLIAFTKKKLTLYVVLIMGNVEIVSTIILWRYIVEEQVYVFAIKIVYTLF
jgi:hypothetical protein